MALLFSSALVEKCSLVEGENNVIVAVKDGKVVSVWKAKDEDIIKAYEAMKEC